VELTETYSKLDRTAWLGVKSYFDLLHPRRGHDREEVVCWQKELACEVSDAEGATPVTVRYVFVRTATGPKLQRLEIEPELDLMHGI
jgi:hypothetical protein